MVSPCSELAISAARRSELLLFIIPNVPGIPGFSQQSKRCVAGRRPNNLVGGVGDLK